MKTARRLTIDASLGTGWGAAKITIRENGRESVSAISGSDAHILETISKILREENERDLNEQEKG